MKSIDFYGDAKKVFQKSEEDIRAEERLKFKNELIEKLEKYCGVQRYLISENVWEIINEMK